MNKKAVGIGYSIFLVKARKNRETISSFLKKPISSRLDGHRRADEAP